MLGDAGLLVNASNGALRCNHPQSQIPAKIKTFPVIPVLGETDGRERQLEEQKWLQ